MLNVTGATEVCGIIGNPVKHSLSPIIHNMISAEMGIDSVYVPFHVDTDVHAIVGSLYTLGVKGINVTVPYKTEVIYEVCGIDPLAREIGAVNTLVGTDKGYLGYNTDITGLDRQLQEEKINLTGKNILIIGAGGAARAVAFLCAGKCPRSITIINRTLSKAISIQNDIASYANRNGIYGLAENISVITFQEIKMLPPVEYVAFQCTNIGLYPNSDACVIHDRDFYRKISVGIDLIYKPENTLFMQYVKSAGGEAHNGLKMLVYQAVSSYEIWHQVNVPGPLIYDVTSELRNKMLFR